MYTYEQPWVGLTICNYSYIQTVRHHHMYLSRGAVLFLFTLLIGVCCFIWSYKLKKTTLHVIEILCIKGILIFSQYVTFSLHGMKVRSVNLQLLFNLLVCIWHELSQCHILEIDHHPPHLKSTENPPATRSQHIKSTCNAWSSWDTK